METVDKTTISGQYVVEELARRMYECTEPTMFKNPNTFEFNFCRGCKSVGYLYFEIFMSADIYHTDLKNELMNWRSKYQEWRNLQLTAVKEGVDQKLLAEQEKKKEEQRMRTKLESQVERKGTKITIDCYDTNDMPTTFVLFENGLTTAFKPETIFRNACDMLVSRGWAEENWLGGKFKKYALRALNATGGLYGLGAEKWSEEQVIAHLLEKVRPGYMYTWHKITVTYESIKYRTLHDLSEYGFRRNMAYHLSGNNDYSTFALVSQVFDKRSTDIYVSSSNYKKITEKIFR